MIKWVRRATLVAALAFAAANVFSFDPQDDLKSAWRAYRARYPDQALRLARRALAFGSADRKQVASALDLQARAALSLKRPDKALPLLDRLVARAPAYAWGYLQRGRLKLAARDPKGALIDLSRGIELASPADKRPPAALAPYLAQRGLANLALARLTQARQDLGASLGLAPREPQAHYLKSLLLEKEGRLLPALEAMELAMQLAQKRDRGFFLKPQGRAWTKRLVWLRMKNKVNPIRPYRHGR